MPKRKYAVVIYEDDETFEDILTQAIETGKGRIPQIDCIVPSLLTCRAEFDAWVKAQNEGELSTAALFLFDVEIKHEDEEGLRALEELRGKPEFSNSPMVVFSKHAGKKFRSRAYGAGANSYVRKPGPSDRAAESLMDILSYWIGRNLSKA